MSNIRAGAAAAAAARAAAALCVSLCAISAAVAHATAARVAPRQQVVTLLAAAHRVRSAPKVNAAIVAWVNPTRPLTGEQTVLPVLAQTTDKHRRIWLEVRLPGRANGGTQPPPTGWIRATHVHVWSTAWHIVINLAARRVLTYRNAQQVQSYPAIVGKPSTPTPTGEYFVEENIQLAPTQIGAPYALATSDRSSTLQQFDGGPGQIALHGLDNIGGQLGTAVSHGCIRLADNTITWLANRIPPGTPITIH